MLNFIKDMGKILPFTLHSIIPSCIMCLAIVGYYIIEEISPTYMLTLHWNIYIICLFSMGVSIYFNRNKPIFFVLSIMVTYLIINNLKFLYTQDYLSQFVYINLCSLLPINLTIFYLLSNSKFFSKKTLYLFIGLIIEFSIFEHLSRKIGIEWNYISSVSLTYNHLSLLISIICGIIILFKASFSGKIMSSYLLFAYIETIFGLIYSDSPSALTMSFFAASVTCFIAICYETYHATYFDPHTSLLSRNSFIINSKNFPIKYSIGIIKIDDYMRMTKIFKKKEMKNLVSMISLLLSEFCHKQNIYRYAQDEFVIIFKDEDKEEAFQKIESIRRKVASADFILAQRKKPIKLTISAGVTEKKRSDANAFEVLVRTSKTLEQTNKFSQNITSKA